MNCDITTENKNEAWYKQKLSPMQQRAAVAVSALCLGLFIEFEFKLLGKLFKGHQF